MISSFGVAAAGDPAARRSEPIPWGWGICVVVLAALIRVLVAVTTPPVWAPDSEGYWELARMIGALNLSGDVGVRTPPYPLLLLVMGNSIQGVVVLQMALGLAITGLLFVTAFRLSGSRPTAVVCALLYAANLPQIHYESTMLSETLTTFLIVCAVALLVRCLGAERECSALAVGGMGLCVGMAALTRPLYSWLPLIFLVPVMVRVRPWRRVVLFAVLAFAPLLVWSSFNYLRLGSYGPTTLPGYALTTHTDPYVKDAPEKYAPIREAYLQTRAAANNERMTIWRAVGPMMRATGASYPELSRTLVAMNLGLIASHPDQYAASVTAAALSFWKGVGRYDNSWVSSSSLPAMEPMWLAWKYISVAMNALFLITVCAGLAVVSVRRRASVVASVAALIALIVLAACLLQALTEAGSGARYAMPTQPIAWLVACLGVLASARALSAWRKRRTPAS